MTDKRPPAGHDDLPPSDDELRDHFAALALIGLIPDAMRHNAKVASDFNAVGFDEIAEKAYAAADAMLRARGR